MKKEILHEVRVFCLALFLISVSAFAQTADDVRGSARPPSEAAIEVLHSPAPEAYGTAAETALAISQWEFSAAQSTAAFGWIDGKYMSAAGGWLDAGFRVPTGALITRIEVQACDTSATGGFTLRLLFNPNNSGFGNNLAIVSSTAAETPGCTLFPVTVTPAKEVNNATEAYYLEYLQSGDFTSNVRLQAVRVYYKLQVSPAPATATFGDVSNSHPFYRFIEALAASGITGGCGGGNFCPNAPITRGEMAVFLAGALGLHFPN